MRREHLYLQDIREACDMIQAFLEGMDASAFLVSELHKAATLQKLTVIGEAAARLSPAFREAHPQVECAILLRSVTSPCMHTLRYSGISCGQRPLMMSPCFGVRS
jgi:uncharacterized protein with HEPN domain